MDKDTWERYANVLNCKLLAFLFTYLGIPIGANPRLESTWNSIVRKFKRKLSTCKHKIFSFAGKVCLDNFVSSSLSIFYLFFFFLIPRG